MKMDKSIKNLLEELDRLFPGAILSHDWMNGTAVPSRQYQITDVDSGDIYAGLSHFIISDGGGEILAKAQIFLNLKNNKNGI